MRASQVVLVPKNLSANAAAGGQETQVWSLGWEDSLEEGMATHCIILAWRILMDREPGRVPMLWQSQTLLKQFITHIYMFIGKAIYYNNFLSKSHKGFILKTSIQTQTQMILDTLLDIRKKIFPIFLYKKVPLSRKLLRLRMINQ